MEGKIVRCKVNHLTDPLGFDLGEKLTFSWNVERAHGRKQTGAQLLIKCADQIVYDTGRSNLSQTGTVVEMDLSPRTRYTWTVTVWTDAGEEITSSENYFETAKLSEKWKAKWISCDHKEPRHPVFLKDFDCIKSKVASARLYICGLGLYEASLNGRKIGDEYLTPYCNDYKEWLQYQTYDVTGLLKSDNTISILMGHGWYSGRFGFESGISSPGFYGQKYLLLAELHVTYTDGNSEIIATDGSWRVERSNITFSNIYDGEWVDDTLKKAAPEKAVVVTAKSAPKAGLTARYSLPVRNIAELRAKRLTTPKGETVFDFGQEITGIFRVTVKEPRGTVIRFQTGEILQDDNFYNDNLRSARSEYVYISDGERHVLEPKFTFYGFRYIKVSRVKGDPRRKGYTLSYIEAQMKGLKGWQKDKVLKEEPLDLKASAITAIALSSDLEKTGTLTTGHSLVNKLISNIEWGCRDNFLDVPTDCPQRDERMGWTADTQVFVPTASYLHDTYGFYRKFLHDMAMEQKSHKGGVTFTIPSFGIDACCSVWGDAATIIPWALYEYYGDVTILEEQFESMKSWVDYITSVDGDDFGWRHSFHFGDWLALDIPGMAGDATSGETDTGFIGDVYYMYSAEIVRDTALVLHQKKDADKYGELAARLRRRILNEFYSPDGRCCCDTQTGLLLTLKHHLAPQERTIERLRHKFKESKGKLNCGFTGAPIMNRVLSENKMEDIADALLLNEEYPGWLHEVRMGATTVWERWNSVDETGHISSTGMNSLNHYAYGSVLEWMYRDLAGIECTEPGFTRALIHPHPIAGLKHLEAEYVSAAGTYKSAWKLVDKNTIEVNVTVPFGAEADLILPKYGKDGSDKTLHLTAGSYKKKYKLNAR